MGRKTTAEAEPELAPEPVEEKAKRTVRTAKRAFDETGFGEFWPVLSDADRKAWGECHDAPKDADAKQALFDAEARAEKIVEAARKRLQDANVQRATRDAILAKCERIRVTRDGEASSSAD